jgi:hypothetical protein
MSRGAQILGSLLLAVFGVALACFALEIGVRVLHLVPTRFWQPDPLLGSVLIPNVDGWWTQEDHEFVTHVRINSDGRRDVERPAARAPGTTRILLLGDSFVEALQVDLEEMLARRLEADLRGAAEVFSMGVSGYGTPSQLLYFRERGRRLEPDLVLLAFYPGNDVLNNSPELETVLPPVYDRDGALQRVGGSRKAPRRPPRSQAYLFVRKLLLTKQPGLSRWLVDLGLMNSAAVRSAPTHAGVPLDFWVYAAEPPPVWQEAWGHTERNLGELRRAVEAAGARFALLIVTARDQVYPDGWQEIVAAHPAMREVEWDLLGPERRVLDWCRRASVPCLQLSPTFAAQRDETVLHFKHDGHWTAAGHALAARTTAEFLRREDLIPGS